MEPASRRSSTFPFFDILGTLVPDTGRANIPPATPLPINGNGPRVIHFPSEFSGYAIDVTINNLDAAASLTYRLNSRISPPQTVSVSGVITFNDVKVVLLEIVTGTNWEVTFNLVPL